MREGDTRRPVACGGSPEKNRKRASRLRACLAYCEKHRLALGGLPRTANTSRAAAASCVGALDGRAPSLRSWRRPRSYWRKAWAS
jgi:hypothetical protein